MDEREQLRQLQMIRDFVDNTANRNNATMTVMEGILRICEESPPDWNMQISQLLRNWVASMKEHS